MSTPKSNPKSNLREEFTLFIVKPDGVQRGLVGEIISRFERKGLKLVAIKMLFPTKDLATKHYESLDEAWLEKVGNRIKESALEAGQIFKYEDPKDAARAVKTSLIKYLCCGPVVVLVLEGANATSQVRKLLGSTDPTKADIGTIRGDFTIDSNTLAYETDRTLRNLAHASENPEEAAKEVKIWFTKEEIVKYNMAIDEILYDPKWDELREEII